MSKILVLTSLGCNPLVGCIPVCSSIHWCVARLPECRIHRSLGCQNVRERNREIMRMSECLRKKQRKIMRMSECLLYWYIGSQNVLCIDQ